MTTFILAGGYTSKPADGGRAFVGSLVAHTTARPTHILICLFAVPKSFWAEKMVSDQEYFSKFISDFTLEMADETQFAEQVRRADVVYFRGGDTRVLIDMLKECPGWADYLDGKVIAGTSAGADMLSRYSYNIDELEIMDGLNLVPVKCIPHWKSDYNAPNVDWDKAYAELKSYKEDIEMMPLAEGDFKIYTI